MNGRRLACLLILIGLFGPAASRAWAGVGSSPFKRDGAASALKLDPFRLAVSDEKAAAVPPAPAAAPAPKTCASDDTCPDETICQNGVCQAVQSSTNVAWLYYREGRFREIFGLYWSKTGSSGYTFLAPIYWHTWTPKGRSHVVAPLFWRFENYLTQNVVTVAVPVLVRSSSPASGFTWFAPLNFLWHDKDVSHQLILPLYYRSRHKDGGVFGSWFGYSAENGSSTHGAALWLYWWGSDRKDRSSHHVLFPILWDFAEGEDRSTVVFPLVWSYGSATENSTIAVPWVHLRRPTWTFDTLFPLWWAGRDGKTGSAFKMLVPVFYWHSGANGRRIAWVSPIGGYSRDDDARSRTLALLPLLTFWHRDPDQQLHVITPLFVRNRSEVDDATTTLLGGALLYRRDDPQGSTTAVTPLFWHFYDAQTNGTATALLPFFAHRAGPRDSTTIVGVPPVWAYWRNFHNGGWSGGLFPLLFFGSNAGRAHAVIFPIFWHSSGPQDSTTVVPPLFYWHREPRRHDGGLPALLAFWGGRDGDSYVIQFPLLWHFASERRATSTTVTPLGYYHRDADGWSLGVGPLLPLFWARSGASRSHAVLFPVFWRFHDADAQKATTVVGPYWHRSWGGETTDGLFPLLHYRRGARPGGTDEKSFTLFPLLHYHRDATTRVVVTPLGASARGPRRAAGFIGPYLWYRDATLDASFVPLVYADVLRRDTGERTRQWGPWFQLNGPDHAAHALFPLFGHYEDKNESATYVFPTFFHRRGTDGSKVDALLPLFWRSSGNDRTATVIGPWYDRTAPGVHNTGLVPLWFHARNPERSLTVIPPLLFVRHHDLKADHERLWCALLWHTRDGAASRTTVFPLWWSAADAGGKSHQVLFPVFWRFADAQANKAWALAGPLYWSSTATAHTRGLLPLFWYSRDGADGSGSTALMPLFYEAHGPRQSAFMTPLFGFKRSPTTRLAYFGPVAPLWLSHTNLRTETETTVIAPLLYVSRLTPESSLRTFGGLFWRQHDVTSSLTLALPLFYDVHDFHLSRTTLFVPLLLRHANEVDRTVTWLAPLFYRSSSPTDSTTVAFPLVWDWKRGDDHRTTLVLPFVAHWRRADHASTWVFPTIYHRTGLAADGSENGTWRTIVAPFYDAAVKRPGDFEWDVLGGLFGHERVGRNRYLKLLFMRFEQEPAPRTQTAWYSQPLRTPRRERTRGLSMNTW